MKILFVSNLFPDSAAPGRGRINATLLRHLAPHAEIRVLSPRAALPLGRWRRPVCRAEDRPFRPAYVRTPYLPGLGGLGNHRLMARALRAPIRQLRSAFPFDVVLCAWVYPDACAVELLGPELDAPLVAVAQGSDVHDYLRRPWRRRAIVRALSRAAATVTRSKDLARRLHAAGVPATKLHPIYNGVDTTVFQPGDARQARYELGLPTDAGIILYVGNLVPVKNPLLLIAAHAALCRTSDRPCELVMVGSGPLEAGARRQAARGGFGAHVRLVGQQTRREVARYMQAADVLCVPSRAKGVPNVLLEAFACGLRGVATRVGGIPEVLDREVLGRLVPGGDAKALANALGETLQQDARPEVIVRHAGQFSWQRTAEAYLSVLRLAALAGDGS